MIPCVYQYYIFGVPVIGIVLNPIENISPNPRCKKDDLEEFLFYINWSSCPLYWKQYEKEVTNDVVITKPG